MMIFFKFGQQQSVLACGLKHNVGNILKGVLLEVLRCNGGKKKSEHDGDDVLEAWDPAKQQ